VLVSVRTKPAMEEAYKKELMDVFKHVFAESNLLNFKVNQNPHKSTRFMFYETRADRNDFETAQLNRPYRKP
jgi:quinol monooxygenase YgiN